MGCRNCKWTISSECAVFFVLDQILSFCRFSFQEKWAKLSGVFPEIQMLCDYEMKGQVLVVPVDGKGNSTIILSTYVFGFF